MKSDYLAANLQDHAFGGPDYSRAATLHLGLASATITPSQTGSTVTELSGGAYARVSLTNNSTNFPASASRQKLTGTTATFPTATADWLKALDFFLADASSAGNILEFGRLITPGSIKFFTATTADVLTVPGNTFVNGDRVRVFGSGLPAGLTNGVVYYVISTSGNTFSLSTSSGGSAVDLTAAGYGEIAIDRGQTILSGSTAKFVNGQISILEV